MNAFAGQCVQVDRQRPHQRLALTGLHLGDATFVQRHAADHLGIEVTHAHDALAGLTHGREGFRQQLVEVFPLRETLAEFRGLGCQRLIGERLKLALERIDRVDPLAQALHFAIIFGTHYLGQEFTQHILSLYVTRGRVTPSHIMTLKRCRQTR